MKIIFFTILTVLLGVNIAVAQKQTRKKTPAQQIKLSAISNNSTDKPLKILYKPRAAYPQPNGGTICIQGVVTLRVQFLETGKIGEIHVISSLPYGANENAIEAAKRMKFEPAMKDGKPVTITKSVHFSFTIY